MNTETLKSAFDAFNHQSLLLESSYRELQDKVTRLSDQLAASQSARYRELSEKERLGNRLARMLEALPGAVIVIDGDGIILDCNSKSTELLSVPLLDCAWSEIVQREFCPGESADGELKLRDGRWLSLARQTLDGEDSEILLLTDVSESRRMSEMLQRHQRLSSIGEMTARLGHQIRTPLSSALLYASKLVRMGSATQKAAAGKVVDRLQDLSGMVNDMLIFAAGTRKTGEIFGVTELFTDVIDSFPPKSVAAGHLQIEIADKDLVVAANREALKGALLNLVDNAFQACGASPTVELGAVRSGEQVCLTVTDNGHGVKDEIYARLFEPFFTTRPRGTGLGLAVVRSVAEAHDGDVLVDSGPEGTTFAICLPALTADQNYSPAQVVNGMEDENV